MTVSGGRSWVASKTSLQSSVNDDRRVPRAICIQDGVGRMLLKTSSSWSICISVHQAEFCPNLHKEIVLQVVCCVKVEVQSSSSMCSQTHRSSSSGEGEIITLHWRVSKPPSWISLILLGMMASLPPAMSAHSGYFWRRVFRASHQFSIGATRTIARSFRARGFGSVTVREQGYQNGVFVLIPVALLLSPRSSFLYYPRRNFVKRFYCFLVLYSMRNFHSFITQIQRQCFQWQRW